MSSSTSGEIVVSMLPLRAKMGHVARDMSWMGEACGKYSIQGMSIVFRTAARYEFFMHADGALDTSEKQ